MESNLVATSEWRSGDWKVVRCSAAVGQAPIDDNLVHFGSSKSLKKVEIKIMELSMFSVVHFGSLKCQKNLDVWAKNVWKPNLT